MDSALELLSRLKLPAYLKTYDLLAAFLTSKHYEEHENKIWSILPVLLNFVL